MEQIPPIIEFVNDHQNTINYPNNLCISAYNFNVYQVLLKSISKYTYENTYVVCPRYFTEKADAQCVVTGTCQYEEKVNSCVYREVFEETGLNLIDVKSFGNFKNKKGQVWNLYTSDSFDGIENSEFIHEPSNENDDRLRKMMCLIYQDFNTLYENLRTAQQSSNFRYFVHDNLFSVCIVKYSVLMERMQELASKKQTGSDWTIFEDIPYTVPAGIENAKKTGTEIWEETQYLREEPPDTPNLESRFIRNVGFSFDYVPKSGEDRQDKINTLERQLYKM